MPSSGLGMTVLYWSADLRKARPVKELTRAGAPETHVHAPMHANHPLIASGLGRRKHSRLWQMCIWWSCVCVPACKPVWSIPAHF
jgi:hypothetical protein